MATTNGRNKGRDFYYFIANGYGTKQLLEKRKKAK